MNYVDFRSNSNDYRLDRSTQCVSAIISLRNGRGTHRASYGTNLLGNVFSHGVSMDLGYYSIIRRLDQRRNTE
jgi:hypothetical protein